MDHELREGKKGHNHHVASGSELFSSAKVVADAAKSAMSHKTENLNKGKVAGAAADLVEAASHYGKLEQKSIGKYLGKAETYLHNYEETHGGSGTKPGGHSVTGSHGSDHSSNEPSHSSHSGGAKEGGYGDYIKMAQGFFNEPSQNSHSGDAKEGGYGDYMKMAEGFLKKH
ncbi:hypothetical protein AMTRI_Chr10g920 [Amborella trichopoda]|uniref:Nodulin-related protein 1 n=1 Tax=Amborella trichopoda TaxID=13333 RepID=W1PSR4_AMBTC|nr:nodulin-related protein 1 [Amborella trichopoda]ERN10300.1 hypothetical protein AMTR_s00177p00045340 [Amborella trichopoda]|eukprot:XP_011625049.1 nodulin-related protein 1 [Amborella trichopoda]